MTVNATTLAPFLKEYYSGDALTEIVYENPELAIFEKKAVSAVGKYYVQPVLYSLGGTASASLTSAIAGQGSPLPEDFQVPYRTLFKEGTIEHLVMLQSKSDKGAFVEAVTLATDCMVKDLSHHLAMRCWRDHGGALASLSAVATTTITNDTWTLTNADDVSNFHVGMQVQASSTDGTSGSVISTVAQITNVNRDDGKLTVNATIPGVASSYYVFPAGTFGNAMNGYLSWCPTSAPGLSDSFLGVNRSVDSWLGGTRVSGSSLPVNVALRKLAARMGRDGVYPDTCFMSPTRFNTLVGELFGKLVYCDVKASDADISFRGVELPLSKGSVKVLPSHNCPQNVASLFVRDAIKLVHVGELIGFWDEGGRLHMHDTYAGYKLRASSYVNMACRAPKELGVVTF